MMENNPNLLYNNKKHTIKIIIIISGAIIAFFGITLLASAIFKSYINRNEPNFEDSLKMSPDNTKLDWYPSDGAVLYTLYNNGQKTDYTTDNTFYLLNDIIPGNYSFSVEASFKTKKTKKTNTVQTVIKFTGLRVIAYADTVNKIYNDRLSIDSLTRGVHYDFENAIYGDDMDLHFSSIDFALPDALISNQVIAIYSSLEGKDASKYDIKPGRLEFGSVIGKRAIEIDLDAVHKEINTDDPNELFYYDYVSRVNVSLGYTRTVGESVGTYNIVSIFTNNPNYIIDLSKFDGTNKFIIDKKNIAPKFTGEPISKVYDGTDYYDSSLLNENVNYYFPDEMAGYPIDISIVDVHFNYSSVDKCTSLIVNYDAFEDDLYTIKKSSFRIPASINPVSLFVYPESRIVQKEMDNKLNFQIHNDEFNIDINGSWIRDEAEKKEVGTYDIIGAVSSNPNFIFTFPLELGVAKYEISEVENIKKDIVITEIISSESSPIVYGEPLGSSLLTQPNSFGYFKWVDEYEVYPVGTHSLSIQFVFDNLNNYNHAGVELIREISITVNKKQIEILDFPESVSLRNGYALGTVLLNNPYGILHWENEETIPTLSGSEYRLLFTPYDTDNYDWTSTIVDKDVVVNIDYPINFNVNGGFSIPTIYGSVIKEIPFTSRSGYILEGWCSDEKLETLVEFPLNIGSQTTLYALWRDKALVFTLNSDKTGYIVSSDIRSVSSAIIIPSVFNGLAVVEIGYGAFSHYYSLVSIVIPSSVKRISTNAFFKCLSLESIYIDNSKSNITFGFNWNTTLVDTLIRFADSLS